LQNFDKINSTSMLQLSLRIYIFYIVVVDTNLILTVVNNNGYHTKTINAYGSLWRIGE